MPDKCSVPGCKSGYKSQSNSSKPVSFHQFPSDPSLCSAWIKAVPRKFDEIPKQARICSEHFCEQDYTILSSDSNSSRKKRRKDTGATFVKKKLKVTAVPHIFPDCPSYLTHTCAFINKRTTPSERDQRIENHQQDLLDQFSKDDSVTTQEYILSKLHKNKVSGFIHELKDELLSFHYISVGSSQKAPEIICSLVIDSSMKFFAFVKRQPVKSCDLKKLLQVTDFKIVSNMTSLSNMLAALKAIAFSNEEKEEPVIVLQDDITDLISKLISVVDDRHVHLLRFIIDQLSLIGKSAFARRYSSNIIITSFLLYSSSPSLYRILSQFFMLPTVRWLKQLSEGFFHPKGMLTCLTWRFE